MTNDQATWTQGKLLTEVYKLESMNNELVEALKRALDCENKNGILSIPCIEQMKQAIEKATQ
jgi:hypothetical protein